MNPFGPPAVPPPASACSSLFSWIHPATRNSSSKRPGPGPTMRTGGNGKHGTAKPCKTTRRQDPYGQTSQGRSNKYGCNRQSSAQKREMNPGNMHAYPGKRWPHPYMSCGRCGKRCAHRAGKKPGGYTGTTGIHGTGKPGCLHPSGSDIAACPRKPPICCIPRCVYCLMEASSGGICFASGLMSPVSVLRKATMPCTSAALNSLLS